MAAVHHHFDQSFSCFGWPQELCQTLRKYSFIRGNNVFALLDVRSVNKTPSSCSRTGQHYAPSIREGTSECRPPPLAYWFDGDKVDWANIVIRRTCWTNNRRTLLPLIESSPFGSSISHCSNVDRLNSSKNIWSDCLPLGYLCTRRRHCKHNQPGCALKHEDAGLMNAQNVTAGEHTSTQSSQPSEYIEIKQPAGPLNAIMATPVCSGQI